MTEIVVTQGDRAMADSICNPIYNPHMHSILCKKFARHRLAAIEECAKEAAKMADLLTKAVGDITAALTLAGKQDKIGQWTKPYIEALNAFDADAEATAIRSLSSSEGR